MIGNIQLEVERCSVITYLTFYQANNFTPSKAITKTIQYTIDNIYVTITNNY